ncbi:MAG: NUDIX hydrolase [Lewinellaceae bacterium]|nr:NUDIX hydrolase [Lewinellaceae bacterium]MCB9352803.1 NUDIX hydrolase [Lewinellaceae bacterium]
MRLGFKKLFLRTLGRVVPSDHFAQRFPVSVKGVCFIGDKVVLLQNERREWDLPGGKLKRKEDIAYCLTREIEEELNIKVTAGQLLTATQINIMGSIDVLVLIYRCSTLASVHDLKISQENFGLGLFTIKELSALGLPASYNHAIHRAHRYHALNGGD